MALNTGLVGYLLDVLTDLKITPIAWIAVFAGCLVIAQFLAYHEVRTALALRDRGLEIPLWAMHVCMANADGAWLTALLVGDAPKRRFNTTRYSEMVAAIDRHFGLNEDSRKVESFADVLRVTAPKDETTPEFQVQLGAHKHGALCVQFRTSADPLPLPWLIQRLDCMMSFLVSDASREVVGRRNREYTLCLNAWPEGGIDATDVVTARRLSQNFVKGSRTIGTYTFPKGDRGGWGVIRTFVSTVLANAGYIDFEPSLGVVTRYSLATIAKADDVEVQRQNLAND